MTRGFMPNTDGGLLGWSLNFRNLIQANPLSVGLTPALAAGYGVLHDNYATAYAAAEPSIRSKFSVAQKNAARTELKNQARLLANLIRGTASVTDAQKVELGLTVKKSGSPIPPPDAAPGLSVISVSAWNVRIRLRDTSGLRSMPAGVSGASFFSFVAPAGSPSATPSDLSDWKFQGNTGRTRLDVTFDSALPPGAKVWLTAFWFNGRKQRGPICTPVSTNLQGGGVALAA
jgi:hypothetical protein